MGVIGARREGIQTLILPKHNEADYSDLKEYLRAGLTAHFVDHFDDVYRLAFDQERVGSLPFESRGMSMVSVSTPLTPSPEGPRPVADGKWGEMPVGNIGGHLPQPLGESPLPPSMRSADG